MNTEDLPAIAGKELERRKYFVRMDVLDSKEGQRPVEVSEFLDEVEKVLAALDLP
jgi:hypothetical protein